MSLFLDSDASGSSDAEGNNICGEGMNDELIDPIDDLEWVRNELVEWVYSNVSSKWDGIIRKGKKKVRDESGVRFTIIVTQIIFGPFDPNSFLTCLVAISKISLLH